MTDLPDPTAGPEQAAHQADLRELVWNAAAGLSERDRALLDLHLRHGLEGAELGEAVGVEPAHAYVLLTRLRDQVERSLGALLVARLGRADCPELSQVLTDWDGHFSPLIRKRVARHVDTCDLCGTTRRKLASPLALLAAVPPMPAPANLRGRVLDRVQLTSAGSGSGGEGSGGGGSGGEGTGGEGSRSVGSGGVGSASPVPGAPAGLPAAGTGAGHPGAAQPAAPTSGPPEGESSRGGELVGSAVHSPLVAVHRPLDGGNDELVGGNDEAGGGKGRRRLAVVALVAAMLLSVGVGVGLGWERSPAESTETSSTGGQGGPVVAGAASSTVPASSPTTTAPSTSTSTSTSGTTTSSTGPALAPPALAASPARVDLGAAATSATLTVRNGGDEPLSWAADPSAPWLRVRPSSGSLNGGRAAQAHPDRDPRRPARGRRRCPGRADLGRPCPLSRGRPSGRARA